MWGRIYPHAVFLIFANIMLEASCKTGSLTFLIDDTSSMGDDIKNVRRSVYRIKDIVLNEMSSLIDNMVLVTLNDPGVHAKIVTKDPDKFKKALDAVKEHNELKRPYLDCWEPAMKGLLLALDKSKNDSYIFVFTDAPAKDYIDSQSVIEMCQKKQTQIVFVLTGTLCSKFKYAPAAIDSYFDIAAACSGLAFFVEKNEVDKVFGPIEEIIKGNKNVITAATVPANVTKSIPFTIDGYTDYVIVYASGKNVSLKIKERSISLKTIMSTDNAKVIKLNNAKPGSYVASVKGATRTSVIIVGRTDFFFTHGFSESKPKSLSDTSPQPISDDATVYLSISVRDDRHSVKIVSVQLLDMDGKPILTNLILSEISKDFYVTDPFVAPSQRFKVAVNGIEVATGKPIGRTAKIPVTPPPPKIAPKVQGVTVLKVKKGETALFECKVVRGFPAPKITWLFGDKSGSKFTPINSESVLLIKNVEDKHDGIYKCVAENVKGKDEHVITLHILDQPKIITNTLTAFKSSEGVASLRLPCSTTGYPKPSITWKLSGRVIHPSAKYSIEDGTLIIRDLKISDTNSYICEAQNEFGVVRATFKTRIGHLPKIVTSDSTIYQSTEGDASLMIPCVATGLPKPNITWKLNGRVINSSRKYSIEEGKLIIRNPTVENTNSYTCEANNEVGTVNATFRAYIRQIPQVSGVAAKQARLGSSASIECTINKGEPKPQVTWQFMDNSRSEFSPISGSDKVLHISRVESKNAGRYKCVAQNNVGSDEHVTALEVQEIPQVSGVAAKHARLGSSASIECTINKGEPKPKVTWQFMDNSHSEFSPIPGSDKVLHISRVQSKNAGRYKCVAQNSVGSDEHITTLEVQDLPKIVTSDSTIYNSTEGDAFLKIPCNATGLPNPNITWKLNGRVINSSSKYSIEEGTLIIRDPTTVDNTNSYKCEATNKVGTDSATFRAYIRQIPQVSGVAAKQARLGSSASIECTINKGEPKPKVTWQFMDNSHSEFSPIPGSDKVLHISRVESKNAGRYKCVAQNSVGSDEHITTLEVQDPPRIVSQTSSVYQSIEGDASLNIPCVATGLPNPNITWKLNGRVINSSSKYSIEEGTLIIRDPTTVDNTNSYKCEATNKVGTDSATFRAYIRQIPQVSGIAAKQARLGSSASIECTINKGEPKPKVTWQFMNNSHSEFSPIPGADKVLHISRVESKNAGRYKCVAQNSVGSDEHITTLEVQDLPKIVTSDSTIYNSTEGDAFLKIPCDATGLPNPNITWKLNGRVINSSSKYSIEEGTLIIRDPTTVDNTNSYKCEATNKVGTDSATFRAYIRQIPQVSGIAAKQARLGSSASIECTINKGEPKPKVTWQFMNNSHSEFSPIPGADKVLHISRVESKNAGRYKCVAQNSVGSDEHITTLEVQDLPKIVTSDSTIYNSTEGDAFLKIPCDATGLPNPNITWKLNGRVINSSSKYSIEEGTLIIRDPTTVDNTNSYKCEATNKVGTDSATFRAYIRQIPQVSGVAAKQARLGSSASIECTINKGEPKPKVTWQFMNNSHSEFSPIPGADKVLHISRVESKNAGRYKCVAQNSVGSDEHITTLEVQDLPKIVTSDSTIYNSTEGDAFLKIPCDATGLPNPNITWKLNGRVINSSSKYSIEEGTLIIRDPTTVDNTNTYKCEATNKVGTDSATFRAYIRQIPQVSGVAAKQARLGSSASIECTINKGEPKPKVTWQFMDNSHSEFSPIPGSDKVLHISRVESKNAGRYKCVAQNSVGSDEHITTLEVQDPPRIVSQTSSVYQSNEGDASLNIPCVATGLPNPNITWKLNGRVINSSSKYSIEKGTLIIRDPTTVDNTNSYKCEATNKVGTDSATFRAYIRQIPQVSGVAAKQARLGSSASIECTINKGEPKPKVTWQFMNNSHSEFSPIPGADKVLHISRVESKNAGRYKCVAQNSVGSDEHITTLEVQDLPKIVTSDSTIYNSTEGDAFLKIPCDATGLPNPNITWKLNGRVINSSSKYSIEEGTLIIRDPTTVDNTNSYKCEATNKVGTDSATFRAYIRQIPQVSGVAAKQARLGSSASIECTINKGEPKPKVTWQFMNNSHSEFSPIPGADKVLHISRVESKNAGRYKCVAQNSVGSDEHITTLEVQDLPKIVTSDSTIYNSTEGDAFLKIPCDATGLPNPNITWKLNGRVINSSSKYSIEEGTLIIRDPTTVDNTNTYKCEATNKVGTDSATFRAYIRQIPQVSGVAAKQARLGSSASIECTINKGEPKPKVTWQFMDNSHSEFSPIPGSDKVLHISRVESKNAGRYKCVALNSVGSDEHITTLEVQDPPRIVSQTSSVYQSNEGDASLNIPCVATGLPNPNITWKLNGRVINSSSKYSIEKGTLIIRDPTTVDNTNSYKCEATNKVGTDSATFRAYIRQIPQVSGVAAKQARLGSSASIECTINKGEPKPKVTWQFMDNSHSEFSPIPGSDKVLHISRVESKNAGRYKCVAQNSVGSDEHITTLEVQDPPRIVSQTSSVYQSIEGDASLNIPCVATGLPNPNITWKLNGRVINSSSKYSIEEGTLIIRDPTTVDNTNSYKCEATNKVGTDSATFRAYIRQIPQVSGIAAKQARLGSSASIECTINKGEPKPKVTWQFMNNSHSEFSPIPGADKVLHISRVESKNAGRYKCVAQNSVGSDEHITTLEVQDLPKIVTSDSTIYNSTEGDAFLKIPCDATGLPNPNITWKLNGRVINSSSKYSIEKGTLIIRDPTTVDNTNSYKCEATNKVGTDSATFRAYIRQIPQVSGVTAKQARLGSSASIECTINKGEPKPNVTWQFMDNSHSEFSPIPGSDKVLHISRVESKNAGRYKCVAQNSVGSDEHITTLEVQDPPRIVSQTSSVYQSIEGDASLNIPCVATGLPNPNITWKLNGRVINSSSKYSIEKGTLIIRDPTTVDNTNSYKCEATNKVGTDSATFRAYIRQIPQVSGVTAKQARLGSSASIECTINKGEPKPKVTWQFMDNSHSEFSPIPGSDKVLHISRVESKNAGRYKCVAQNSVGSDEHITTLEVQDPPRIVSQTSSVYQSIEGDASLNIPCVATGLPNPNITWKLNGRVINSSSKYSIEKETLIIRDPTTVDNTNSYKCEATNKVGTDSATFRAYIRQIPQVSGVAAKQARLGSSASIECTINKGEPKPKVTWQFMDNSHSEFSPIPGSDKVLHISRVESKNAGRYKCVAQNSVGSDEHITTLEVQDPPRIVSQTSSVYQSIEGDASLNIPCVATGLPKPKITWQLDGRIVNPSDKFSIQDGTLIIRDPTVSDANSYTCEARNEVGADSATFKTYIRQAPQLSGVAAMKVRIGSPSSIECTVKGEPKPTITWQFMDNSRSEFSPIPGSNKVLHISRVESKHAGRYKCVARNSVGSDEHITTLEAQEVPEIKSNVSTIYESTEGDAVLKIPCIAAGLPKPSITWKLNGHVINLSVKYSMEDGTLIIRDPKVSDTNSYTCEAKNEVGTVSATFKTYIRQFPKLSGVAAKNVRMGSPVNIECKIDQGEPTPKISWQFMDKAASKFVPIAGVTTILRIANAENKHAGRYKCVAQNNVGSDEHITTLIVESLPRITINSTKVEGVQGDLALKIPCNVVGVPQPAITWKINGITITPNAKYSIEDGALIIVKPAVIDSSLYTCEAKNYIGSISATFEATVTSYPKNGTEHNVHLREGETRKIECEAYSSKSQSVKWFETKRLDSSQNTTSSPLEFDSLETSTASNSNKDSSTTPPTIDTGNKEPYVQIVNASSSNHAGNYTCRVSDKHGNTQTHTYVVDVGNAPEFYSVDTYISEWRGDISDIKQICAVQQNLLPTPLVQWTFNGKVLTDLNSAGVGQYICNVSNVHGSVLKRFDVKSSACLITRNIKNAPYMPLVLNDEGTWHKFENTKHYTIVEEDVKIILSCPSPKETSNTFKSFRTKSKLEAICIKEDTFLIGDKIYKLSDLQCTNSIQPSVIKKKVKCLTSTSELISVGYNVPDFLEAYEVCFDHKINMPLYTRIMMTATNNNGLNAGYNWYTYPGIGNEKTERGFTCKNASSSCCYSKSQLVNAVDFNDGPAKKSTFIDPLNAIPVWLPCNGDNTSMSWEDVNDKVREKLATYTDIAVWSGTHTLQEKNGAIIPRYLWKVVRHADDEIMAIVHVNDPKPTEKDIKCKTPDICKENYDWLVRDSTYCCLLPDFLESFDFHGTDFAEILDAALDKMKEIPDEFGF